MEARYKEELPYLYSSVLRQNGSVLMKIGGDANINRAIELYQQGIVFLKNQHERHPDLPISYENLAEIHDALGNTDAAEECRQQILRLEDG